MTSARSTSPCTWCGPPMTGSLMTRYYTISDDQRLFWWIYIKTNETRTATVTVTRKNIPKFKNWYRQCAYFLQRQLFFCVFQTLNDQTLRWNLIFPPPGREVFPDPPPTQAGRQLLRPRPQVQPRWLPVGHRCQDTRLRRSFQADPKGLLRKRTVKLNRTAMTLNPLHEKP